MLKPYFSLLHHWACKVYVFAIYDLVTPVELNRVILISYPSALNGAVHVYKYEYMMKI